VDFEEVVRKRRMVRTFLDRPLDPQVVERILRNGHRAPSAGNTQGYAFLVLEGEGASRFWGSVTRDGEMEWMQKIRSAPLLIVPLASKRAYLERYAEPDKGWTDRDEAHWPVPYWYVDTAFAAMLMLLTAVDEGLGALFFGLGEPEIPRLRRTFGVPEDHHPIGVIAVGHPAPDTVPSSARRGRRPIVDVVHRGRW
jgi:nitroreductase